MKAWLIRVPTATFQVLFGFLMLAHDRRRVVHFNVTVEFPEVGGLHHRYERRAA